MNIKIYQINTDRDSNMVAFESFHRLPRYQGTDKVDSKIYDKVFEGEVDCDGLEAVYQTFNVWSRPKDYKGRSMSVSDVVEIVDENGDSTFHFCNNIGFILIEFDPSVAGVSA